MNEGVSAFRVILPAAVISACALAKKGWNAEKIQKFHFPGSVLRDWRR